MLLEFLWNKATAQSSLKSVQLKCLITLSRLQTPDERSFAKCSTISRLGCALTHSNKWVMRHWPWNWYRYYVKCVAKAHLFNAEKGSPSTWIFTIARNIRFDMLQKLRNRKEDVCSDDLWPVLCEQTADANEAPLDEQVTLEQIGHLFESLPVKQKAVVEAIYIDGKSQQEVSDELSIPLGTVKSRTRLALQRLKVMLNDND